MDSLLGQSLNLASKLIANANSLTTEALPPSSSSSYPSSSSSLSPLHPTPSPLLLLPLLASTSSLTLSLSHYLSIRPLVHSEVSDEQIPPRAVQRYWDAWWVAGLGSAGLVGVVGTIGGMVELSGRRWATRQTQGAFVGLGTMFMLGGFTFTPKIARLVREIIRGPNKTARKTTSLWLQLHTLRIVSTDLPAFLCFLTAVLL